MPSTPSWLQASNPVEAASAGARLGLQLREANENALARQFSQGQSQQSLDEQQARDLANQGEAAARLKFSYDSLAQQAQHQKQQLVIQSAQQQAVAALRQAQQQSLAEYRKNLTDNRNTRTRDAEKKQSAAQDLQAKIDSDIPGFYKDAAENGVAAAAQKHPMALQEPGIRSSVAQSLLNPKVGGSSGQVDLDIPGAVTPGAHWWSGSSQGDPTKLKNVPLDSPLVNQFGDPKLSAVAGTNLVRRLNPAQSLLGASAAAPTATNLPQPNPSHLEYLKAHPESAPFFDQKFGAGAALKFLNDAADTGE